MSLAKRDTKTITAAIISLAALAVAFGWYQLFRFSSTPGKQYKAPIQWPHDMPRIGNAQTPSMLVFIHPQCSCTHATLEQLDRILDASGVKTQIALVTYQSQRLDEHGGSSGFEPRKWLHKQISIVSDTDGNLARRFGAATSGEVVLYSTNGRLLFQGGVTPERAHVGDSTGGTQLRDALRTGLVQGNESSVFGCPLFARHDPS